MANPRKFSEKIALHNQKQAEETAEFEKIMKEVSDATSKSLTNNDDLKTHIGSPRERARSAVGPIRARPGDKRTDTSPYSSSYLSPPLDTGWRRTHSDSSLHTSSQEQITAQRRGTIDSDVPFADPLRRNISASHVGKATFEMSRIPVSVMSSPPDNVHNAMGKNTGSLPDLTCCHFPSPLDTPIDQEDRGPPYQPANPGNGFSTSTYQHTRINKLPFVGSPPHEAPGPPQTPPQYSVNYNNGIPHQFVYHPVSPLQPTSPQSVPPQQQTFNTYRTPVSRPSPQPSPSLSVRFPVGSPRSGSPQSPSSPGSVSSGMSPFPDHQSYINLQTNALQHHFENISMTDDNCSQLTQDPSYFSTSPSHQGHYSSKINTLNAQTAPNTPSSIPDIVLTDFSNTEELAKDLGEAIGVPSLESDLFPTDDCLREGLDPIDFEGLQMLTDSDLITDPATEDHFRLDRL